ncbi:hypothetical protein FRUB_06396 [Fimbriiglobus ruber]|uniref:Uncharacterized protein n=1 Tax=Fimbriiglobus ruber TaxID=1908690 RepID=A0A225DBH8_9BACT|nr:hypothetical protein FRUB_06396 [Fimbriiglobus ruber]
MNGTPVPSGVITFHSEVGNHDVFNAPIRDGRYSVDGVPVGAAVVTVRNTGSGPPVTEQAKKPSAAPAGDGKVGDSGTKPKPAAPASGAVPARYGDPATSGLSTSIRAGAQVYPLDLAP